MPPYWMIVCKVRCDGRLAGHESPRRAFLGSLLTRRSAAPSGLRLGSPETDPVLQTPASGSRTKRYARLLFVTRG